MKIAALALASVSLLALSACDTKKKEVPTGSLTHHLKLVGEDGRNYGRAELDPVGGGRLYDAGGQLIGTVQMVAQPAQMVPAEQY